MYRTLPGADRALAEAWGPVAFPSSLTRLGLEEFGAAAVSCVYGVGGIKCLMLQLGRAKPSLVRELASPTRSILSKHHVLRKLVCVGSG